MAGFLKRLLAALLELIQKKKHPMAIVQIGSARGVGVSSVAITVPLGGVPTGNALVVVASETSSVGGGITDTAGSGFIGINEQDPNNTSTVSIFVSASGNVLLQGDSITYTLGQAGQSANIEAFYIEGVDVSLGNHIVEFIGSNNGINSSPLIVSSPSSSPYQVFVSAIAAPTSIVSFTQDSINANWISPPGQVSLSAPALVGGSLMIANSVSTSVTYAPKLGNSVPWAGLTASIIRKPPVIGLVSVSEI